MMLLLLVIAAPVLGAIILTLTRGRVMTFIGIAVTSVVLVLSVLGLREVVFGVPMVWELPSFGIYTLCLHADSTSAIFVFLTALVWFAVSLYAPGYLKHERRVLTFYVCFLITLAAVLGVFLAGDLLTLLLCFEVMTVASFFWVFHRQDSEAIRASYLYLFFGIFAGLCLTIGIVFLGASGSSLRIGVGVIEPLNWSYVTWGLALLVVGFGVKAGMVPFHVWLPHAHSVAITPGSALLSGVLIKAGAYGLIRTGELAGFGMTVETYASWLGPALVAFGVVTMVLGVVLALFQSNAKKLLAYHSISQMGYIILGLGIGLFMGSEGSLGLAGAIYHVFNHGLFKSVLFLGVGIVYIRTGEIDLYRLGGLWRNLPVTALLMLIAALGITGVPGLNGYASKTLLHHAVSEAAQTGMPLMIWAEWLFLLVGVGTAASFAKLIYLMFLGRRKSQLSSASTGSLWFVGMSILSIVMIVIGLRPGLFVSELAMLATLELGIQDATDVLGSVAFWSVSDLLGMGITVGLGILVCWAGLRSGFFHLEFPKWLSLRVMGGLIARGVQCALELIRREWSTVFAAMGRACRQMHSYVMMLSREIDYADDGRFSKANFSNLSFDAFLLLTILIVLVVYHFLKTGGMQVIVGSL